MSAPTEDDARRVAAIGPWGGDASDLPAWLVAHSAGDEGPSTPRLPNVPGFLESPFLNLACATLTRCLPRRPDAHPAAVGLVLASVLGDTTTADRASVAVAAGGVPQPLLFYQSVPSALFGRVTVEAPVSGPLVCLSGGPDLCDDALEVAELMLGNQDVDQVIVTYTDAGTGPWRAAAADTLRRMWGQEVVPAWDCSFSVVLGAGGIPPSPIPTLQDTLPRPFRDFAALATTVVSAPASTGARTPPPTRGAQA